MTAPKLKVIWKKDSKQQKPQNSFVDVVEFAQKHPVLLCDFLENFLKFQNDN
jgi:hypothetical protein